MKKSRYVIGSICGAALLLMGATSEGQDVLSQNVVGYFNITVNQGLNLVAFPFQKIPASRGIVTANDATTITVDSAGWAADFGYDEPGESTFYAEITTGVFEGRHMYVESHTADTLTIVGGLPADIGANELAGEGLKIVAANRIRDLFGEPGEPSLAGASSSGNADTVRLWMGSTWSGAIYYQTTDPLFGTPVNAWKQGSTEVNDMVIGRDEAVFILRKGAEDVVLTVVGEVSPNDQQIVLQEGLNLVGGLRVEEEVIDDSTLITQDTIQGASSSAGADTIRSWMGTTWSGAVYYQTTDPLFGTPVNEWKQGSQTVSESFAFSPVRGYFLNVQPSALTTKIWSRSAPAALSE